MVLTKYKRRRTRRGKPMNKRMIVRRGGSGRYLRPIQAINKGFLYLTRKVRWGLSGSGGQIAGNVTANIPATTSNYALQFGTPVQIGGSANYMVPFSMQFCLSDIINYTDVTQLADQYKIIGVKVAISYNSNVADVDSGSAMPYIFYTTDNDDSALLSVQQIKERMGVQSRYYSSSKMVVFINAKPKVAPLIFGSDSTGSSAYAVPIKPTWINSEYPSAPHYGVRGFIGNWYLPGSKETTTIFDFDVTYKVVAKDFQ